MAKWNPIPAEPLFFQPHQDAFLKARRLRHCKVCKSEYSVTPPNIVCPICNTVGNRKFDRLTIIAGRRFGKSRFGSIAGAEEATIPNTIGWACAPSNPKLERYVIPAFQQLIPTQWVESYNSEFKDLRLKNGSLIHFQTLEDPDQGRGQGLDWLWIDEVCELTEMHWNVIRPSLIDRKGVAFFTTSPRSYDWVYEKLYKPAEDEEPGYWACRAQTRDNPKITQDELDREKAQMPDAMYRQEYEADFVTFTGAVYGDILVPQILRTDGEIKLIIPEWPEIADWRQVLIGIDTGADHPFGAVKLISTEKGLVVVGEYLERHKSFIEHAAAMKRLGNSSNIKWAINRNERQPMIELAQHQIFCQKAENDVVAGTERVKTWLHNHKLWFIESKCPLTIKQMKAYRWAENVSPKDGQSRLKEKVYKKDDELPDCLRYSVITWHQLPKTEIDPNPQRDLSALPTDVRATIERVRRVEDREKKKDETQDVTLDFWT